MKEGITLPVVLGMALVTLLPRILSVVAVETVSLPPVVKKWLNGIPFAVFGALIIPGAWTSVPDAPAAGLAGAVAAGILALCKVHAVFCVLGAIIVATMLRSF